MNTSNEFVPNHLVWAILVTLFCCLPLGIVSIVYAAQVDGKRAAGDLPGAYKASHNAKMWAIYSAIIGPLLLIAYLFFLGGLGMLGAFGNMQ